jgi:hypothetical protein
VAKKKKSRVPAPPRPAQGSERRVQAPQRRVDHGGDGSRSRMWFLVLGGVLLAAAIAAGIAWATLRGDSSQASGVDGPCVIATFPSQGQQHVEELSDSFKYNSFPPTSGPHYPVGEKAPIVWNIYEAPLDQVALVHNLEHGGVVVQYGSEVSPQTVQQLSAWYAESPEGLIVAPLPDSMPEAADPPPDAERKIFLTSWTHLATCSAFDEDAFNNFLDDFRGPDGDAPEKFPLSALQPGGQ